jgi:hypothetical protein
MRFSRTPASLRHREKRISSGKRLEAGELHKHRLVGGREFGCGEDFRALQIGFKQPLEEFRRLDMTFSFLAQNNEAGIQCQGTCGVLGGRVGEREAAAQRAAVADRRVRDVRRCLGKERRMFPYVRRFFDLRVSNECADAQGLPLKGYPLQFP